MGIEPTYAAWEAAVLPLNYARETRDLPGFDTFPVVSQVVVLWPHSCPGNYPSMGLHCWTAIEIM